MNGNLQENLSLRKEKPMAENAPMKYGGAVRSCALVDVKPC